METQRDAHSDSHRLKVFAIAVAVFAGAYLLLVVSGRIPAANRLSAADCGVVVVAALVIAAAWKPDFFERLQKVDFAGVKVELGEVKKGQIEVQKHQQEQQAVLDDVRLALRLLITEKERDHLRNLFTPATDTGTYDRSTWNYEQGGDLSGKADLASHNGQTAATGNPTPPMLPPNVAYDLTLQHPRCVFQLLKQQYSRYTPETVERITGIPKEQYLKAIDLFTSVRTDGDMKRVAAIIYAVGWTQHTFGTQIIRTAAMLQLLLGNVGRAGAA